MKFDLVPDQTKGIDLLIKLVFALRRGIADIAESSKVVVKEIDSEN